MVPTQIQTPATKIADVKQELAERQDPFLRPLCPALGLRGWVGREPPADAYDFGREDGNWHLLVRVGGEFGDVDGGFAVDPVAQVGGEGGCVAVDVQLFFFLNTLLLLV